MRFCNNSDEQIIGQDIRQREVQLDLLVSCYETIININGLLLNLLTSYNSSHSQCVKIRQIHT